MHNLTDLKIAKTSRSAIDSLQNSRQEFQSMITKLDHEIMETSQEVRTPNGTAANPSINRINKLKLHRKRMSDLLTVMDEGGESTWELLRPEAQQVYEDAIMARQ